MCWRSLEDVVTFRDKTSTCTWHQSTAGWVCIPLLKKLHCLRSGGVTVDSHPKIITLLTSALRGTFSKRYSLYPAFHDLLSFFIPMEWIKNWVDTVLTITVLLRKELSLWRRLADFERLRAWLSWYKCSSRSRERVSCLLFFINSNLFILPAHILDFRLH